MSVSLVTLLCEPPISQAISPHLTIVDICRLTALCKAMRSKWLLRCGSVLNVLKRALAYFKWPCLPPLNDELKKESCEYNVFCGMMEANCRLENIDFKFEKNMFCIGQCGTITCFKCGFVGKQFAKFTICRMCKPNLPADYVVFEGRWNMVDLHMKMLQNLVDVSFQNTVTEYDVAKRFYNKKQRAANVYTTCLSQHFLPTEDHAAFSKDFIEQQVAVHLSEILQSNKRQKI